MHTATKAHSISRAVKEAVWERDGGRCILCLCPDAAPNAHYLPRSQGGRGIEENIVTLRRSCHDAYDNSGQRPFLRAEIRAYLSARYPNWDERTLVYHK